MLEALGQIGGIMFLLVVAALIFLTLIAEPKP